MSGLIGQWGDWDALRINAEMSFNALRHSISEVCGVPDADFIVLAPLQQPPDLHLRGTRAGHTSAKNCSFFVCSVTAVTPDANLGMEAQGKTPCRLLQAKLTSCQPSWISAFPQPMSPVVAAKHQRPRYREQTTVHTGS